MKVKDILPLFNKGNKINIYGLPSDKYPSTFGLHDLEPDQDWILAYDGDIAYVPYYLMEYPLVTEDGDALIEVSAYQNEHSVALPLIEITVKETAELA